MERKDHSYPLQDDGLLQHFPLNAKANIDFTTMAISCVYMHTLIQPYRYSQLTPVRGIRSAKEGI